MEEPSINDLIRNEALKLGFSEVGFAKVRRLDEEDHLSQWLNKEYHGEMKYMEDHFEKRLDPSKLVPGAKTVISFLHNYYPEDELEGHYKISRYAYGKDYHKVIKKKLKKLAERIEHVHGAFEYRMFVDSAPLMERQWAREAGLGWTGKNTLLINKQKGSYFFLAELVVDFETTYNTPIKDYCGTCTACLDACPTKAFPEPYLLDASKCISYLTIELKEDQIPTEFNGQFEDWIYGCDICQEVCPWNRFSEPHKEDKFKPSEQLKAMTRSEWEEMNETKFDALFEGSAVKRTKFKGLKRNIGFSAED